MVLIGRSRKRSGGTILGLALGVALAGCASGPSGPVGPVVSPTGIVYPPGIPPARTRFSQTAALYLVQGYVDRALAIALEGLAADSMNPVHYFLAGSAYARLGSYRDADSLFDRAQLLYPAYELQVEPQRAAAWAEAYNDGVQAYGTGDFEGAMSAWRDAAVIYDLRPEAHANLANMLAREGRYEEAIVAYEGALAGLGKLPATQVLPEEEVRARADARTSTQASLAQVYLFTGRFEDAEPLLRRQLERDSSSVQIRRDLAAALRGVGRIDEATQIYSELLTEDNIESTELFNLGVALFRAGDYVPASEAFERLTQIRPNSRDAWFNYANSLFAARSWSALATAGDRLVELDPLGKNVGLIAARAHLEAGDQQGALAGLKRVDGAPVHLEELQMRPIETVTRVLGTVIGNTAEPGSPLTLRFTFYDDEAALGSVEVGLTAPPVGESSPLEVNFTARATAYSYEVVP